MIPMGFSNTMEGFKKVSEEIKNKMETKKEGLLEKPVEVEKKTVFDEKVGDWAKPIKVKLEQNEADDVQENNSDVKSMQTKNQDLEGKKHPVTGVPFVRKEVENSDGEKVEVVVPEFESAYDVQLPEELLEATDKEQFDECNRQLKDAIEKDPELRSKFTDEQIEQIMDGETPDGYTWHHDAEKGKMQLVDSKTHAQTGHTGGKAIWGGGKENR